MNRACLSVLTLLIVASFLHAQTDNAVLLPPQEVLVPEAAPRLSRLWFSSEYLMWWIRGNPLPSPLYSAAVPPFNSPNPGAVGDPRTHILIGQESIDTSVRSGGRFTLGGWFDDAATIGFEGNYFFLGRRTEGKSFFTDGSKDSPITGVPFHDVFGFGGGGPNSETFLPFSVPGFITAHSQVRISNFLQGAEANALFNLRRDAGFSANLIAGYRYLQLAENLSLTNNLDGIDFAKGLFVHFEDNFETRNTFNGGQIGLGTQFRSGRWFLDASGKIALGQMNEVIDVFGRTAIMPFPGSPMKVAQEGFFAQQSNSGLHSRNVLAYIPEVTLNVGVNVTSRISAFVGYNFIYVSNVLRPGDQIDRSVNLTQSSTIGLGTLIGPARPTTQFNNTDFWAQGINFGFRVRF